MVTTYTKYFDRIMNLILVDCSIQLPNSQEENPEQLSALWDTGANITCISTRLAEKLKLESFDEAMLSVANNEIFRAKTYYVQLNMGEFSIPFIKVLGLPMDKSKDIIIGMDVISKGDLSITNYAGKTVLSFREPSMGTVDYSKGVVEL